MCSHLTQGLTVLPPTLSLLSQNKKFGKHNNSSPEYEYVYVSSSRYIPQCPLFAPVYYSVPSSRMLTPVHTSTLYPLFTPVRTLESTLYSLHPCTYLGLLFAHACNVQCTELSSLFNPLHTSNPLHPVSIPQPPHPPIYISAHS